MLQAMNRQVAIQSLKGKLVAVYEYLLEKNDRENAEKVRQLAGKLANEEFTIAFCGHFSAGKSKMINRLVGENLLPSSPIPTSANLVKVKAGEEYVKVFFKNEKPRLYLPPYDYKMVKNYCKDGDQIQEIELSHADSKLPEKTVVMDTPGIDSADDAHRIATESAIHLADLIFYVMDYNHVQSALNFMFTKELMEAGKEVCLVVNQVDKHSEQEISFAAFKTSVAESFASWGVKPAHIFYTSLKASDHEHNQFPELQAFLAERLQEKDNLLLASVRHSLQKISKDYFTSLRGKNEQMLQPCKAVLAELSAAEQADLAASYSQLQAEKDVLCGDVVTAEAAFETAIDKIMDNAYLMSFETRTLAEAYLAASQPGFKVGLLFAKQKTLAERQARLDRFYQDMLEKTKSQVEWHLRDFLLRFVKEKRVANKVLLEAIQSMQIHFSTEVLTGAVKAGARLSGEYVLNYTDHVANEIKRLAKSGLTGIKGDILKELQVKTTASQASLNEKSANLERYLRAWEQLKECEAAESLEQTKLERLLSRVHDFAEDRFALFAPGEVAFEVVRGQDDPVDPAKEASLPITKPFVQEEISLCLPVQVESNDRMKTTAGRLQKTAQLVQGLPGFAKLADELAEKAARLAAKGFTVALFGAFSAGKSSFANALLGESVLPVSPNPMTAAVNKIKPVDASHQHGMVFVKLKLEQAMLEDVNHALKIFGFQATSLIEARAKVAKIQENSVKQAGAAAKTNYTFLQAFSRGYTTFDARLGMVFQTTLAEFGDYVAQEEKSCFVEWIDLYYDCPLTRKGITLVDTPGADSINARHTSVAFDFIKNSDAILFVTYYNHAFSKADREFLIQLGRVKDAFQLDKMFFIINAIDLADDAAEMESVVDYVRQQLTKYGVRKPHLYPVSSLTGLHEKKENPEISISGMPAFEESFYHFITADLAALAVVAAENELRRVYHLLAKLIENTREDISVKQQKRFNIEAEQALLQELLGQQSAAALRNRMNQQCEKLVYYSKQRVFLRFNDFFREAFNPTVLRDDGRNLKKVLQASLEEFLEQIGFDFAQELRATTVRLDSFAKKITAEYQTALGEKFYEINPDISFSLFEYANKAQIDFATAFTDMSPGRFVKAMTYFKTPKAFFEKNENKLMHEELYRVLNAAADEYLKREQRRLQAFYETGLENEFSELILQMRQETADFYLSLLSALDGGVPTEQLMDIQKSLAELR